MSEEIVIVIHAVVKVDLKAQKFRTEISVETEVPPVLRLVAAAHLIRDLLDPNGIGADVLDE